MIIAARMPQSPSGLRCQFLRGEVKMRTTVSGHHPYNLAAKERDRESRPLAA